MVYNQYTSSKKFNPGFSISYTKLKNYFDCEFKYILTSYGSWEIGAKALGLSYEMQKEIYILKKLNTLDSIVGSEVHKVLALITRKKKNNPQSEMNFTIERISKGIHNMYESSKQIAMKITIEALNGNKVRSNDKLLSEIYFCEAGNVDLNDLAKKDVSLKKKIDVISKNIIESEIFQEITSPDTDIIMVEKIEDGKFPKIAFHQSDVFANVDLVYRFRKNNQNIVIDWKTGEPDPEVEKIQLYLYALYISYKFFSGDISLVCNATYINEYLLLGKRYTHFISEQALAEFIDFLTKTINQIKSKLHDSINNIPLPISNYSRKKKENNCRFCEMKIVCMSIPGGM